MKKLYIYLALILFFTLISTQSTQSVTLATSFLAAVFLSSLLFIFYFIFSFLESAVIKTYKKFKG